MVSSRGGCRYDPDMTCKAIVISLLSVLAAALVGCAETRSYQVAVRNETPEEITVGFAKEGGGPYEPQWATPEEIALASPADDGRNWDSVVVPPGKTGVAGPVKGKFEGGAKPFLRVYGAKGALNELLSISRGSPRRADVPLVAGRNALIVKEDAGKLTVEHVQLPAPKS
jgi:hypothetical protein